MIDSCNFNSQPTLPPPKKNKNNNNTQTKQNKNTVINYNTNEQNHL